MTHVGRIVSRMDGILASGTAVEPVFVLLGLVLAATVAVSLVFASLRQSLILGYFLCGILLGNSGLIERLGFAHTEAVIAALADTGVVLLMFTLGIEFSLGELRKLRRLALGAGGFQMAATIASAAGLSAWLAGTSAAVSMLVGFMVALSSTALALKMFQEAGHGTGPGARLALGIALFQDLGVIVLLLILPVLFGRGGDTSLAGALASALGRGILFCGGAFLFSRYVVPFLLGKVSLTRSRELFTLTVVGICAGVAAAAHELGLSLALGAFVAGLLVSDSVYSHRIMADALPFKDLFLALFFVSVGLLIRIGDFLAHWWFFLLVAASLYIAKALIVFFAGRVVGMSLRACVQAAFALGSIGEFSLVILQKGLQVGVLEPRHEQFFLIVTALSMALAPLASRFCRPMARLLESWPLFRKHVRAEPGTVRTGVEALHGHAIVCGYGPVGRRLDDALRRCGLETVVVELNVESVAERQAQGLPVLFADAARSETLSLAGIERAAVVAVTFPHFEAAQAVVSHALSLRPEVPILCRAKFDQEVALLRRIGVECVVQDELESAAGMVDRALRVFERPAEEIQAEIEHLRLQAGTCGESPPPSPGN